MVWLARKAFFGHVPFPAMHIDTGKKFPEMYAFRDRYAAEWKLNLLREDCPPVEMTDPTLPPAARSAERKTLGLRDTIEKYGFKGIIAGIRRDEEGLRAKERVFSPRGDSGQWDFRDQPPEFWDHFNTDLPAGTHLRVHPLLHWTERDIWRYIQPRGDSPGRSLFRQERQALPLAGRHGHHLSHGEHGRDAWTTSSPSSTPPRRRSGPAAPWTARPRTPSSACAPRGTCDGQRPRQPGPRARAACASSSSAMSTMASRPWSAASSTTPARCPTASSTPSRPCASAAACPSNGPS